MTRKYDRYNRYDRYDRCFIVMSQEAGGYCMAGQKLQGSALLELRNGKGLLTMTIQGLKNVKGTLYEIYLISAGEKGTLGFPAGELTLSDSGKCSKKYEFEPGGLAGSSVSYDDINVVAVIAKNNLSSDINAPLVGYRNNHVLWKNSFKEYGRAVEASKPEPKAAEPVSAAKVLTIDYDNGLSIVYNELMFKLKNFTEFDQMDALAEFLNNLEKNISGETYCQLLRVMNIILDYIPGEVYNHIVELLKYIFRFIPGETYNPIVELYNTLSEYVPSKVMETLTDCLEQIATELSSCEDDFYLSLSSALQQALEIIRASDSDVMTPYMPELPETPCVLGAPADDEPVNNQSNELGFAPIFEDEYATSRDFFERKCGCEESPSAIQFENAVPGDDHDARFREALKDFSEQFGKLEGKTKEPDRQSPFGQFNESHLMDIFDKRPQMYPFPESANEHELLETPLQFAPAGGHSHFFPLRHIKWIRVTQRDISLLPIDVWKFSNDAFIAMAYKKYRHFIFGIAGKGKRKTYYFGVPGAFSIWDKKRAENLGFQVFLPIKGGFPKDGEYGYWVMEL